MFVHLVMLNFHDPAVAPEAAERLRSMVGQVPTLRHLEVGVDELRTERSWDLALTTHFDDRAGYEAYAIDSFHKGVLRWMKPHVKAAAAVDYTCFAPVFQPRTRWCSRGLLTRSFSPVAPEITTTGLCSA